MHSRTAALTSTLLLVASATACSGGSAKPSPAVTVTRTVTASPGTEKAKADDGVLKMGTKENVDDDANKVHITVQAVEYRQPYKGPKPQKPEDFQGGDIWATISVKRATPEKPPDTSHVGWRSARIPPSSAVAVQLPVRSRASGVSSCPAAPESPLRPC
ncbi:hypothetical protein [Streptomyces sp. NPDC003435]